MSTLHPAMPELPKRIASLPVDSRGFPVPWFVQWFKNGKPCEAGEGVPDFRVADSRKFDRAIIEGRCWVCGERLGRTFAFVIGPMCALNRNTAEPPCHVDCAVFSARACPFLTKPAVTRREGMPVGVVDPAGGMIERNPGVALVWVTRHFELYRTQAGPGGIRAGTLIEIGEPFELLWFCEGRRATKAEVLHSITTGLPKLREIADLEPAGSRRDEAHRQLDIAYANTLTLVNRIDEVPAQADLEPLTNTGIFDIERERKG